MSTKPTTGQAKSTKQTASTKHTTKSTKHTAAPAKKTTPAKSTTSKTTTAKTVGKPAQHATPRKLALAPGVDVSCCAAEALAACARLAGLAVVDDDVLELYWRTAETPDAGATILDTLRAAAEHGIAGHRPRMLRPVDALHAGVIAGVQLPGGPHALALGHGDTVWSWREPHTLDGLSAGPIEESWAVVW